LKPASNFSKRPKKKSVNSSQSGDIRIIGGRWRGRKLKVHSKEGLRPTTDRLKETLFNWLMMEIRDADVLDCFAGAGSLSFEAASRGARSVVCIEKDKLAASQLKVNCQTLNATDQVHVIQGDFFTACKSQTEVFDLVFVDPPFHKDFVPKVMKALIAQELVADQGLLYLEQESSARFDLAASEWGAKFELVKEKNAGQVSAQLFRYIG